MRRRGAKGDNLSFTDNISEPEIISLIMIAMTGGEEKILSKVANCFYLN